MAKYKVVASGYVRPVALAKLEQFFDLKRKNSSTPPAVWEAWLQEAQGIFSLGNIVVNEKFLAKAPNLKVVAQVSVGYDNIDVEACSKRGVLVGNTPGVVTEATADIAFGLILNSARFLHKAWLHVCSGEWEKRKPFELGVDLYGKRLGILGFGNIGSAVAKRASASGMEIVYHNRQPSKDAEQCGARYLSLDELLTTSDFILVMLPLSAQTKKLIGREQFAKMKPTARFINAARGGIVDTDALYEALLQKQIAYAALDVTDPEPLPADHPLLKLDNVFVLPHIGSSTEETRDAMSLLTVENLRTGLLGEKMPACVNAKA